jgi:hypothetical protein
VYLCRLLKGYYDHAFDGLLGREYMRTNSMSLRLLDPSSLAVGLLHLCAEIGVCWLAYCIKGTGKLHSVCQAGPFGSGWRTDGLQDVNAQAVCTPWCHVAWAQSPGFLQPAICSMLKNSYLCEMLRLMICVFVHGCGYTGTVCCF